MIWLGDLLVRPTEFEQSFVVVVVSVCVGVMVRPPGFEPKWVRNHS